MIGDFYHPFHDQVVMTSETAERVTGERILGTCPDTGRTVLIRMSRFGPVAQIGAPSELAEDEKPKYANLKAGQNMEDIDLIEALKLFGLPKTLGKYEDEEIIVGAGRYGPYVKYKETFISLAKGEDPMTVTLQRAADLIQEKLKADAPIAQFQGKAVTKGTGRFGPFIKWNDMYINIPVRYKVDTITQEQCEELITTKLEKEANRFIQEWPTENLAIENGRWGPFIKLGKDNYKLKIDGKNATPEEAAAITLEAVKAMVKEQNPTAFDKKIVAKKAPAKKGAAVAKKAPAKKK
jgi:DNA topoisomerase-1